MTESIEVRWFFASKLNPLDPLFHNAVETPTRTDWYAFPCHEGSGIKIREEKLETKLRHTQFGPQSFGTVEGVVEGWKKWSFPCSPDDIPTDSILSTAGWIAVKKTRFLRIFSVDGAGATERTATSDRSWPENGTLLEYTEIQAGELQWWTIGLESFGDSAALFRNLNVTATLVFNQYDHNSVFTIHNSFAYPTWLQQVPR